MTTDNVGYVRTPSEGVVPTLVNEREVGPFLRLFGPPLMDRGASSADPLLLPGQRAASPPRRRPLLRVRHEVNR